jgi:hypothetical protein
MITASVTLTAEDQKKIALELADWLKAKGIDFDDAAPILAMTIGLIIGQQAKGTSVPQVEKGCDIMHQMIRVAALFTAMKDNEEEAAKETKRPPH